MQFQVLQNIIFALDWLRMKNKFLKLNKSKINNRHCVTLHPKDLSHTFTSRWKFALVLKIGLRKLVTSLSPRSERKKTSKS